MAIEQPIQSPGHFRWNKGGWFGGQIGGTAWMIVWGAVLVYQAPVIGLCWVLLGVALNGFGCWLWSRRDWLAPFPAIQSFFLACGVAGIAAVVALDVARSDAFRDSFFRRDGRFLIEDYRQYSLRPAYLFFLLGIPAMMGWFALIEFGMRKTRGTQHTIRPGMADRSGTSE